MPYPKFDRTDLDVKKLADRKNKVILKEIIFLLIINRNHLSDRGWQAY